MSEEVKTEINNNDEDKVIDIETKFKNMKSIDDLNFDDISQMGRGKTPEDIAQRCLTLCKDYLSGNWSQQTIESIEVRRITGGLMNQIYYCGIKTPDNSAAVPQEVAVRLYGKNMFDSDKGRIRDTVISLVFSEKGLGPKIYGLFEEGQIQKLYKHRQFMGEDQKNPELLNKVFQAMAQVHSLEMPLKKEPKTLTILDDALERALNKNENLNQLIDEFKCESLGKYDLKAEINWFKGVVKRLNSPVVFTHNDFRSSNLMVAEPNDELVVCDFDLSNYGYRGNDFTSLMREWGPRKQFDLKSIEGLPLDSEFKPMVKIYVEECVRIHGKSFAENENNSVEHILKEAKTFMLFGFLFFTLIVLSGRPEEEMTEEEKKEPPNHKLMMEFSEMNYKHYHTVKGLLERQKIFE